MILVWYFTKLSKPTQLLFQSQTVTGNVYVAAKKIDNAIGIRVSPQLTAPTDPTHNE